MDRKDVVLLGTLYAVFCKLPGKQRSRTNRSNLNQVSFSGRLQGKCEQQHVSLHTLFFEVPNVWKECELIVKNYIYLKVH